MHADTKPRRDYTVTFSRSWLAAWFRACDARRYTAEIHRMKLSSQNPGPVQHWPWCRQKTLNRRGKCPCNDVTDEMPFIRADWLIECDLRQLPRMQDLPLEAFLSPGQMDYCYFISHRWLQRQHPDVTGRQLAVALPSVWCDSAPRQFMGDQEHRKQTGVWYDYLCMPQHPRTEVEHHQFQALLKQHSGLTLITIPILVVDRDVDYASRAWCVAEILGTHISGFSGKSVSLAMYALKYPEVLYHGKSAWHSDLDIDDGFRPGLHKLQSWLEQNGISVQASSDQTKQDWQKHKDCMHAANQVYFDFCIAKQKGLSLTDDDLLLTIARRNGLQCTYEDDLLTCMRIMAHILRSFD